MKADPFWDEVHPDHIHWDKFPLKSYSELFPDLKSGTFSSNPAVIQAILYRPPRPALTPTESQLAALQRHYPTADSNSPPWDEIKADLLAGGMLPDVIKQLTSGDAVLLLDRVRRSDSIQQAQNSAISGADPETLAELQHIRSLGVNQQPLAMRAFGINQEARRRERERLSSNHSPTVARPAPPPTAGTDKSQENHQQQAVETIADRARNIAARIEGLAEHVVASFKLTDPAQRVAQVNQITLAISTDAAPVIMWIERHQPQAADLEKARLANMSREAERTAASEAPECAGGQMAPQDGSRPLSEGARLYATLAAFCYLFSHAMESWAADIEAYEARASAPNAAVNQESDRNGESKVDSRNKIRQRLPDNVDVRDLCKRLEQSKPQLLSRAKSELAVAREFTGEPKGQSPKAQSLLRQARRYPHLWK